MIWLTRACLCMSDWHSCPVQLVPFSDHLGQNPVSHFCHHHYLFTPMGPRNRKSPSTDLQPRQSARRLPAPPNEWRDAQQRTGLNVCCAGRRIVAITLAAATAQGFLFICIVAPQGRLVNSDVRPLGQRGVLEGHVSAGGNLKLVPTWTAPSSGQAWRATLVACGATRASPRHDALGHPRRSGPHCRGGTCRPRSSRRRRSRRGWGCEPRSGSGRFGSAASR